MDLLTIFINGVGSGIAKRILNIWLADEPLAKEIGKNIAGIIASKTKDALTKRRGKRQFDEISEKVAENLLSIFDSVGDEISEENKKQVTELAGQAINNLKSPQNYY